MSHKTQLLAFAWASLLFMAVNANADEDKLRDLGTNAAPGEIPKWDGSKWRNAHDDITTVVPGPGLTGGGTNTTVSVGVVFAGTGTSNTVARADHNHPDLEAARPPLGAVAAWLKTYPGTPTNLPPSWVECNGQILNDTNSPYHGQMIPSLNGQQQFLRGGTSSGQTGGAESHNHRWYVDGSSGSNGGITGTDANHYTFNENGDNYSSSFNSPSALYTSKDVVLPPFYQVVWIIRVK